MADPIKFSETLVELLARAKAREPNNKKPRQRLCNKVKISQAMLSQYLTGKATPRLPKLVALADYFGVDLDMLVFGREAAKPVVDLGPFEFVSKSLDALHADQTAYFTAVARITAALARKVRAAARKVAEDDENVAGGVLHDADVFELEPLSTETVLVRMTLDYEFPARKGRAARTQPGGRFLPMLAKNMLNRRKYTYILPGDPAEWRGPVKDFRLALRKQGLSDSLLAEVCEVIVTPAPLVAGCVLYKLPLGHFKAKSPALFHRLERFIHANRDHGWLGCTLPPSTRLQANPIMDANHLHRTHRMITQLLKMGHTNL